jgi:hypothetical protein
MSLWVKTDIGHARTFSIPQMATEARVHITFSNIRQLCLCLFPSTISTAIADKVDAFSGGEDLEWYDRRKRFHASDSKGPIWETETYLFAKVLV